MSKKSLKIDNIDMKILHELQKNARISNVELSQIVGISPSPCLRRLKALQEKGIIKGFFTEINEAIFSYELTTFASIVIDIKSDTERELFEKSINEIEEVKEVYSLSLDSDYLIKILAKDWFDYKKILNSKISKVPFITKIKTTQISRVIKKEHGIILPEITITD